jgi:hypothetical protein
MTTNTTSALVLKDGEGTYYLLTPDLLDQARVSAERRVQLEQALNGDVVGFHRNEWETFRLLGALPTLTPAALPPQLSPEALLTTAKVEETFDNRR